MFHLTQRIFRTRAGGKQLWIGPKSHPLKGARPLTYAPLPEKGGLNILAETGGAFGAKCTRNYSECAATIETDKILDGYQAWLKKNGEKWELVHQALQDFFFEMGTEL